MEDIPEEPKKRKPHKSHKLVDESVVFELAKIHCTMSEISAVVGCSVDTLEKHFSETIKRGDEEGKASLRRMMYKKAVGGNIAMLIWLSKQRLGYRDKQPDEPGVTNFNVFVSEVPKQMGVVKKIIEAEAKKIEIEKENEPNG